LRRLLHPFGSRRRSESRRLSRRLGLATALLAAVTAGLTAAVIPAGANEGEKFNEDGNILMSDQFNNRVIEIDRHHHVVWQFGIGPNDVSDKSILGVNDAQRVGKLTLMAGTGVPAGAEPNCPSGCPDNRVILVDRAGNIKWQYGTFGVTGSADNELNTPVQDTWLPGGHVLITDQGNQRVIEVSQQHKVVWQYGETGVMGSGPNQLNNPNSAELLENGHILISDENNNRVIEVNRNHDIVWQYPVLVDTNLLSGAAFASRLENGNTLITDSNNNRIIEVTHDGKVVWTFVTNTRAGSNTMPLPTRAVRLENGHTLISDQFNHQVIEVNRAGKIVFTQGEINVPGDTLNHLNAPYDAKQIGDYTGLTPPFGDD
jgi:outer membrane protein assembly factor BamB